MLRSREEPPSRITVMRSAAPDRPAVPLLHGIEGLRLIASVGVASIHMLVHAGIKMPEDFTLFVDPVICLMLLLGIGISDLEFHKPLYLLTYTAAPLRALPSFALGVFLARFAPFLAGRLSSRLVRHACLALLTITLLCMAWDINGYGVLALIYLLVAASYIGDLKGLPTVMAWRPISRSGYLTYSIYMLHVPVTTIFLAYLFPRLFGVSEPALIFEAVVAATILVGLAQLSFRYFEDPVRRLLR